MDGRAETIRRTATVSAALVCCLMLSTEWVRAQPPVRNARGTATVSGVLYDPLGNPVEDVPLQIAPGVNEAPFYAEARTDRSGRFTFEHVPAGRYDISAPVDFFPRVAVRVPAGESIEQDIHMEVEPFVDAFEVCADCGLVEAFELPQSVVKELQSDREGDWSRAIRTAEPAGGWESHRSPLLDYPQALRDAAIEGRVIIAGRIGADGFATDLHSVAASRDELIPVAIDALMQLRWEPAHVRGLPIEIPLRITIDFKLNRR